MPDRRFLLALGGVFFLIVLVRTAWLSELSYLTLRTIEHAATGHGLRWNVSERVQVFDHPLWMLLLLAGRGLAGESYFTTFVISLALSGTTAALVLRSAARAEGIVLGTVMLSLSWAVVAYSTSGLEGPLAHLLVVSFCLISLSERPRSMRTMALLAGLSALTHVSTLLITAPVLIAAHIRAQHGTRERAGTIVVLAGAPVLLWTVFATFYYGTPVPTPVIAEWNEAAGIGSRVHAAARMFGFVLREDPITLTIVIAALTVGLGDDSRTRPLAWGVVSYILVLALWAGDGMPGRWLALPCLVSALMILRHPGIERHGVFPAAVAASLGLAAVPSLATIQSDVRFGTGSQVTDSRDPRVRDYRATGLLLDIRQWYPPHHPEATRGGVAWRDTNRVKTSPHPAYFGFAAGYGVHVVDRTGRTDPLLARLPADAATVFPAGAVRRVPDGYESSLPNTDNRIADPALAAYYDRVRWVTRGPLLSGWRIFDALRIMVGSRTPSVGFPGPSPGHLQGATAGASRAQRGPQEGSSSCSHVVGIRLALIQVRPAHEALWGVAGGDGHR
jgi:arabinofuranosyltransferase